MIRFFLFCTDSGDMTILISISGELPTGEWRSTRQKMCLTLIALSGFSPGDPLKKFGDVIFWVDFEEYSNIEMTQLFWLLAILDYTIRQKEINQ